LFIKELVGTNKVYMKTTGLQQKEAGNPLGRQPLLLLINQANY
jgi:hypothetical protein